MRKPRTRAEIAADPRVVSIWKEEDGAFEGYASSWWVELHPAYEWEECSCLPEPTLAKIVAKLGDVQLRREGD